MIVNKSNLLCLAGMAFSCCGMIINQAKAEVDREKLAKTIADLVKKEL